MSLLGGRFYTLKNSFMRNRWQLLFVKKSQNLYTVLYHSFCNKKQKKNLY